MKEKTIKRGDLFYYDFGDNAGSVQCGERPVLVLQANDYNRNAPTVIVAALTSVVKKRYLPSHIVIGENFGLKKSSMVLLEQVQTVNKSELKEYIGTIDDESFIKEINTAIKKILGLWVYQPIKEENIRCLCRKCLSGYFENPDFIIKRVDQFAKNKDKCDICGKPGWDYEVIERKSTN